jgi:peroxiredoxin Q/BCP
MFFFIIDRHRYSDAKSRQKKGYPMTELGIGAKAPEFDLPRDGKGRVSLSKFRGKPLVLFFYAKDDTPACTAQSIDFSARAPEFAAANAAILGISPDSVRRHDNFVRKHGLAVALASDEGKSTLEAYGVWKEKSMFGRKYMGVERTTFLIGADGRIARVWNRVRVDGHVEDVLKAVQGL